MGLYDASSLIALRLFGERIMPVEELVGARVADALALRERLFGSASTKTDTDGDADGDANTPTDETTAYRLLYGEGDYLPGVTVDLYERYAVLQTYAESVEVMVPQVVKEVSRRLNLRGVVSRGEGGLVPLWGQRPPPELTVRENGLKIIANLYEGQKTGLFLDHRDNRATFRRLTAGKTVLNLFSYTGAFTLYALRGGATHVTSIDIAAGATRDARRNVAANGFDPEAHTFLTADCFERLEHYAQEGRTFDVVVLDPPSLARSKGKRYAALRAYRKLNALAARCVSPGGLLATASCTSQVSPADFTKLLGDAAVEAGKRLQTIHEAGHAPDHPVPATFPEGRYLKFVVARVL